MEGAGDLLNALRAHPGFGAAPVLSLSIELPGCAAVLLDDYGGGLALGRHLLGLGHRNFLTHDGHDYRAIQRRQGFHAALGECGLQPESHCVPYTWHSSSLGQPPSPSAGPFLQLVQAHPEVTCVVGSNDPDACEIAGHLQRAGYEIPGDLSLTGYDDTDALLDQGGTNMLTTVRVELREAGRVGAKRLLKQIHGHAEDFAATRVTLPADLVARRSTAPPGVGNRTVISPTIPEPNLNSPR